MKKILALFPEVREQECHHDAFHYKGRMPCTGPLVCMMCGIRKEDIEGKEPTRMNQEMAYFDKCERLEKRMYLLESTLRKLLTEGLAIHGDDLADPRTIELCHTVLKAKEPRA